MRLVLSFNPFFIFGGGRECFYVDVLCPYAISRSAELSGQPITLTKKKKKQANDGRKSLYDDQWWHNYMMSERFVRRHWL